MRVYILDNGGSGLDKILTWLSENSSIKEVSVIKNPDVFLERIERERPEMVFVRVGNIEFPGLKIGRMVKAIDEEIRIIFISDEKDYAIDAYEIGVYGYLLCPVEKKSFDKCLMMAD
jgi:two-component SAPR family response regulator